MNDLQKKALYAIRENLAEARTALVRIDGFNDKDTNQGQAYRYVDDAQDWLNAALKSMSK